MAFLQTLAHWPIVNFHTGGMSVELTMLAFAVVLGFVQLFLAAHFVTSERGVAWNVGPRDETPPLKGKLAGRLDRAFWNFLETFPFFAIAVLIAAILNRHNWETVWGSQIYLAARVLYVPLYAFGITGLRTLAFLTATAGIILVMAALFVPGV